MLPIIRSELGELVVIYRPLDQNIRWINIGTTCRLNVDTLETNKALEAMLYNLKRNLTDDISLLFDTYMGKDTDFNTFRLEGALGDTPVGWYLKYSRHKPEDSILVSSSEADNERLTCALCIGERDGQIYA